MFSMKNIKATFIEKVKNGETKSEMALGVAEIVGKTAAAGATAVVYNAPDIVMAILNDKINEGNKRMASGQMSDDEAARFSELSSRANETMSNFSENRSDSSGFFHFLSNEAAEEREVKNIKKKISRNYKTISEEAKNILNNEEEFQLLIEAKTEEAFREAAASLEHSNTSIEAEELGIETENSEEYSELKINSNIEKIGALFKENDKLEERLRVYGEEISGEELILMLYGKNKFFEFRREFCDRANIIFDNKIQELSGNQENANEIELLQKLKEENLNELKKAIEFLSVLEESQNLLAEN